MGAAVDGVRRDLARQARRKAAGRGFAGEAEAQRVEMGRLERSCAQTLAVGGAARAGFRDMADRVGAFIAEVRGVGRAATAERIENQQDGARHYSAIALPAPTDSMRKAAANSARV